MNYKSGTVITLLLLFLSGCKESANEPVDSKISLPKFELDIKGVIYSSVLSGCWDRVAYGDSILYTKDSINYDTFFLYLKSNIKWLNPYPSDTIFFHGDTISIVKTENGKPDKKPFYIYPKQDSSEYNIEINNEKVIVKSKKINQIPYAFFNKFDLSNAFSVSYIKTESFMKIKTVVYLIKGYGILFQIESTTDNSCETDYRLIDKKYYPK